MTSTEPKTLTNKQVDALCYMESFFWENHELPSAAAIAKEVLMEEKAVVKWFKEDIFSAALEAWGLKFQDEGKLTPQQILAVNMVLNLADNRSMRQKLKEINVTVAKYNNWLRDPTFQRYIRQRTEDLFANGDNSAYISLLKQIENGDMRAIQLYFEMTGIYNPKINVEVNVEVVLSKVVDILVRHIDDPQVLDAIGSEIQTLSASTKQGAVAALPVGRAS